MSANARRAWIALTVTGTILLIAGVVTTAAGLALSPGTEQGIPPLILAGGVLAGSGLLCGAGLLIAAGAGSGGRASRQLKGTARARRLGTPKTLARLNSPRGLRSLGPKRLGKLGNLREGRTAAGRPARAGTFPVAGHAVAQPGALGENGPPAPAQPGAFGESAPGRGQPPGTGADPGTARESGATPAPGADAPQRGPFEPARSAAPRYPGVGGEAENRAPFGPGINPFESADDSGEPLSERSERPGDLCGPAGEPFAAADDSGEPLSERSEQPGDLCGPAGEPFAAAGDSLGPPGEPFEPAGDSLGPPGEPDTGETSEEWLRSLRPGGPPR